LSGAHYYAVRAHTTGFGSYKQLLPPLWIQSVVANGIVIVGIVIGIVTGRDNIFTAPEYSGGGEGKTWFHVIAHVVVGVVVFPLITRAGARAARGQGLAGLGGGVARRHDGAALVGGGGARDVHGRADPHRARVADHRLPGRPAGDVPPLHGSPRGPSSAT